MPFMRCFPAAWLVYAFQDPDEPQIGSIPNSARGWHCTKTFTVGHLLSRIVRGILCQYLE